MLVFRCSERKEQERFWTEWWQA